MHQSSWFSFDFAPICTNTAPVKADRIKSMVQDYMISDQALSTRLECNFIFETISFYYINAWIFLHGLLAYNTVIQKSSHEF